MLTKGKEITMNLKNKIAAMTMPQKLVAAFVIIVILGTIINAVA